MAQKVHSNNETSSRIKNLIQSTDMQTHKARPQLIVDAESGPYKTIQEAIDQSDPGSIIKIAPGLYSDNIVINKPNLILEPKEKVGDIIMVVQSKPAIYINLRKGEKCTIIGMKLSHSGNTEDVQKKLSTFHLIFSEKIEKMMEDKKFAISLFNQDDDTNEAQSPYAKLQPDNELINKFPIDPSMNCILLVSGGTVILEECLLSLNFIVNNYKNTLPAIVVHNGADFSMNKVEVKGNKNHETVGILIKKSDATIKECKIHSHLMGGILVWAKKKNKISIVNCKIVFNTKAGIHIVGQESNCLIEGNKIEHNAGAGVKIGIANKSSLIRNEIKMNTNGVEVVSADPFIFSNKIDKNFEHGILTHCFKDLRCDGRIKTNLSISGNTFCGICCIGANNFTKIEQNSFIGYNKKAGIKADEEARIFIHKNKVTKNFGQGVLLVESSSAVVEKNEITDNIKANIALGGQNSINTLIVENKISGGRCEGIFMIEGGQSWIMRNTIQENNDGIVIMKSVPEINGNTIIKNKSNGIMLLNYSNPKIINNLIADNDGIGLFIREKCIGTFKNNVIKSNEIELVIEKQNKHLEEIQKNNNVTGDIRIPQNFECNIF